MDLSFVRVHFNSPKPALVNALAFTQRHHIHLGPGQERHLPHEGWHAVQQMQGRVKPTALQREAPVNDEVGLEREADLMGSKAIHIGRASGAAMPSPDRGTLLKTNRHSESRSVHGPQQNLGNQTIQLTVDQQGESTAVATSAAQILATPPTDLAKLIAMIDSIPDAGTGMVKHQKGILMRQDPATKKWTEDIELEEKERSEALGTIELVRPGIRRLTAADVGLDPDQHNAAAILRKVKAELFAKLNQKTIYFSQKANLDLVMTPAWKNTCNVTTMGMNLHALGVRADDFKGNRKKLLKIADNYAVKDPFSLRMPDFMQLVAIYNSPTLKGKRLAQFTKKAINKARIDAVVLGKDKYKITKAGTLKGLAKLFPVTAVPEFMTFPKQDEGPKTAKERRAAVAAYETDIKNRMQPHLDRGSQIEIALQGHWVRLQSFAKEGLVIDDPWTKGNNALIPWNQAYKKRYGLAYIIISK